MVGVLLPKGLLGATQQQPVLGAGSPQPMLGGWQPGTTPQWVPDWLRNLSSNITTGTQQSMQNISNLTQRIPGAGPMTPEDFRVLMALGMTAGPTYQAYKGMYPYQWKGPQEGQPIDLSQGQTEWAPGIPHAGFYSSNPDVASHFAQATSNQGAVFPVHLNFENPFVIDAKGAHAGDLQFGLNADKWKSILSDPKTDGVIIHNVEDAGGRGTIYVPKTGGQVSSSIGVPGLVADTSAPKGIPARKLFYFPKGK